MQAQGKSLTLYSLRTYLNHHPINFNSQNIPKMHLFPRKSRQFMFGPPNTSSGTFNPQQPEMSNVVRSAIAKEIQGNTTSAAKPDHSSVEDFSKVENDTVLATNPISGLSELDLEVCVTKSNLNGKTTIPLLVKKRPENEEDVSVLEKIKQEYEANDPSETAEQEEEPLIESPPLSPGEVRTLVPPYPTTIWGILFIVSAVAYIVPIVFCTSMVSEFL